MAVYSAGSDPEIHLLSTGSAKQKVDMLNAAHLLIEHGYKLYATGSMHCFISRL